MPTPPRQPVPAPQRQVRRNQPRREQSREPCHEHPAIIDRPLPDLTAVRLAAVPDSAPPYDRELPADATSDSAYSHGGSTAEQDASVTLGERPAVSGTSDQPAPSQAVPGQAVPSRPVPSRPVPSRPVPSPSVPSQPVPSQPVPGRSVPGRSVPGRGAGNPELPGRFAQVMAETLAGSRPARQADTWTTESARKRIRQLGPLLAVGQQPRIQRVVTSRPAADVMEIAAVVGFGTRTRALAMRFEHEAAQPALPGRPARVARWLCTAIEAA
jgi:hypothetical protein